MVVKYGCEKCGLSFTLGSYAEYFGKPKADSRMMVCEACGTSHQARCQNAHGHWQIYGKPVPKFHILSIRTVSTFEKDERKHRDRLQAISKSPFSRLCMTAGIILFPLVIVGRIIANVVILVILGLIALLPYNGRSLLHGYRLLGDVALLTREELSNISCAHCCMQGTIIGTLSGFTEKRPLTAICPHCKTLSLLVLSDYELFSLPNGRTVKMRFPWGTTF